MEDNYYDEQADRLLLSIVDEGEDNSFPNYVETTINPGNTLLIIAIVSSLCSIACVPLVARLGNCISKCSKTKCKKLHKFISSVDDHGDSKDGIEEEEERHINNEAPAWLDTPETSRQPSFVRRGIIESHHGFPSTTRAAGVVGVGVDSPRPDVGLEICNEPAEQLKDSTGIIYFTKEVMRFERESKRIICLSIPFTCSAIAKTSSELFILAIISHTVGNDAMIAYAVTFSLVGITSTFMGGFHDSVNTLVGMAYGAENYTWQDSTYEQHA